MLGLLGSLGGDLLGGLFGQQQNSQNIAAQEFMNQQNLQQQLNFAQNGIQWRVNDARAAGINPLAALGASTASFSNLVAPQGNVANPLGTAAQNMGQDVARAAQAMQSPEAQAVAAEKTRLDLESLQLDNDIKRSSLMSSSRLVKQPGSGPGLMGAKAPFPPDARTFVDPSDRGHPVLYPSAEFQASNWGSQAGENAWWWRHVAPAVFGFNIPSDWAEPSAGRHWYLNPFTRSGYQLPDVRQTRRGGRMDTTGMWDPFGLKGGD